MSGGNPTIADIVEAYPNGFSYNTLFINKNIKKIAANAFADLLNNPAFDPIKNIVQEYSNDTQLLTIENYAFNRSFKNLAHVNLTNASQINDNAFSYNINLRDLTINNNGAIPTTLSDRYSLNN
jgi:hypothetical protein